MGLRDPHGYSWPLDPDPSVKIAKRVHLNNLKLIFIVKSGDKKPLNMASPDGGLKPSAKVRKKSFLQKL